MNYNFRFNALLPYAGEIVRGIGTTLQLTCLTMAIALVIGLFVALARMSDHRLMSGAARVYVEAIRNTPLLVQLFIVFFGLPSVGIRLDAYVAALIGLSINVGAYASEILRAGIQSIRPSQVEAGRALGMTAGQTFRHVVLFPAIKAIYPALTSQFILLMLSSAVVSAISADDLTSVAANLQSQTFRSFEIYIVVAVIYLALALAFSALFRLIYQRALNYPDRR